MSFLIDPPWLYATGRVYGQLMPERTPAARALHTATAGTFLLTSISLYLNRPWTRRMPSSAPHRWSASHPGLGV